MVLDHPMEQRRSISWLLDLSEDGSQARALGLHGPTVGDELANASNYFRRARFFFAGAEGLDNVAGAYRERLSSVSGVPHQRIAGRGQKGGIHHCTNGAGRPLRGPAFRNCVARISKRPQFGLIALSLWEADILKTPEFQHPIQCIEGSRDLGRSTLIDARLETITDDVFEAANVGRHQQSSVVVGATLLHEP